MNQQSQSGKKYDLPLNVEKEIVNYAKNNAIKKVVLFGSRARCTNSERSDIDIAVYGGNFDSFYFDIKENVNSLLMFDIVEANKRISEELENEIKKDGVVIYEKA
ncbi:MAG: nucleotidyltransferase domain-containing protein [Lachnospiraceae bacterium]|nr:nucleotidyltransferase domain-containing protein [Lachnospiraceae bacterium]MDD7327714.1 nucleotidyltransferase domain-containing protein [Lachnospiraceae bacterium]MDY2758782.1 nucleotidyltransferase domain-containing protein [Lachnospiraceae bacterium]